MHDTMDAHAAASSLLYANIAWAERAPAMSEPGVDQAATTSGRRAPHGGNDERKAGAAEERKSSSSLLSSTDVGAAVLEAGPVLGQNPSLCPCRCGPPWPHRCASQPLDLGIGPWPAPELKDLEAAAGSEMRTTGRQRQLWDTSMKLR